MTLPTVHVLYENPAWLPPVLTGLEAEGFTARPVALDQALLDPSRPPSPGIWLNRISPSSHTRGHDHTVALAREVLYQLELCGRRVVNGLAAFELEMSKFRQDLILRRAGIRTPRTLLAVGREHLLAAAESFGTRSIQTGSVGTPFITKHNQGGKGLGIHRFADAAAFRRHLDSGAFDPGPDSKVILQQYIAAAGPHITRVELVGGRFLFAMRSSTLKGFQLCPADACQLPEGDACPADGGTFSPSPLTADDPLVQRYEQLCRREGIEIAGIEFVEGTDGHRYTYDINGTTNYNRVLGERIGVDGMREVARYLRRTVAPALSRVA